MSTLDIAVAALALDGLAWPVLIAAGKLRAGQCGCGPLAAAAAPRLRLTPNRVPVPAAEAALRGSGEAMTRRQAADVLGVGEKRVLSLGRSGDLKEIPQGPGRAVLVTAESVERLLAEQASSQPQEVA